MKIIRYDAGKRFKRKMQSNKTCNIFWKLPHLVFKRQPIILKGTNTLYTSAHGVICILTPASECQWYEKQDGDDDHGDTGKFYVEKLQ